MIHHKNDHLGRYKRKWVFDRLNGAMRKWVITTLSHCHWRSRRGFFDAEAVSILNIAEIHDQWFDAVCDPAEPPNMETINDDLRDDDDDLSTFDSMDQVLCSVDEEDSEGEADYFQWPFLRLIKTQTTGRIFFWRICANGFSIAIQASRPSPSSWSFSAYCQFWLSFPKPAKHCWKHRDKLHVRPGKYFHCRFRTGISI